jgi:hypothetical protein
MREPLQLDYQGEADDAVHGDYDAIHEVQYAGWCQLARLHRDKRPGNKSTNGHSGDGMDRTFQRAAIR